MFPPLNSTVQTAAQHTPGPWRWEFNEQHRSVHLVGGKPMYDLTIMDFSRWGMNGAGINLRDTAHDGLNLMHKLHERRDWIAPFPGRAHHAHWCAGVTHPDMKLIAAAPDLLDALQPFAAHSSSEETITITVRTADVNRARAAIAKAKGGAS